MDLELIDVALFIRVEFIELNAQLKPLNLGQGFPDFMPAESVVKELARACEQEAEPLLHQYTRSMVGCPLEKVEETVEL